MFTQTTKFSDKQKKKWDGKTVSGLHQYFKGEDEVGKKYHPSVKVHSYCILNLLEVVPEESWIILCSFTIASTSG